MIGLILGALAIILPWFSLNLPVFALIALPLGVVGIVLSIQEMQKVKSANQQNNLPLIGLIVSVVGTVIALPFMFCFFAACRIGCSAGAGMGWLFGI